MVHEGRINATGEGKGRRVTMGSILYIGKLDSAALEADGRAAMSLQNQERGVRHHIKGQF
tara:strand:- start:10317 stop:10496 length:180 start_codon:yes stop_codon:yes gene_type:complete